MHIHAVQHILSIMQHDDNNNNNDPSNNMHILDKLKPDWILLKPVFNTIVVRGWIFGQG